VGIRFGFWKQIIRLHTQKLTKTSGNPIVLNIGDITSVSEAADQFGAEPSTQITLGGSVNKNYLHVKESMEQIETLIA